MNRTFLLLLSLLAFRCASTDELTQDELSKIDMQLQPVLQGGMPTGGCPTSVDEIGLTRFHVIIRGSADDIRMAGIPVESAFGEVLTANVGVEQIRMLARLATVRSIECGSQNTSH